MAEYDRGGVVASAFLVIFLGALVIFFYSVGLYGYAVFGAIGALYFVYIPIIGIRERVELTPDGVHFRKGLFRRGDISWTDIESIGVTKNWFKSEYGRVLGRLRITRSSGKRLRMPSFLTPGGLGEDSARVVLNDIVEYARGHGHEHTVLDGGSDE